MIGRHSYLALAVLCLLTPVGALAQSDEAASNPSAADSAKGMDERPDSIRVGHSPLGPLLTDEHGKTLYALDARLVRSRYGVGADYCRAECAQKWIAVTAPKDASPIGRWKVITGASGAQWAWNNNPVFTNMDDKAPGSITGNGFDALWAVIAYVPPQPTVVVPAAVNIVFADANYVMTDDDGHKLFTGSCAINCDGWQPLGAGQASRPVGDWQVSRDGDRAHWLYKGKPVFVTASGLPQGGIMLSP